MSFHCRSILRLLLTACLFWGTSPLQAQSQREGLVFSGGQPFRPSASPAEQSEPESIPAPTPEKTTPATAESGLTMAELERMALDCNPTLAQAAMNVRAAEGIYVQAGLYPNPTVGYVGDEIGNNGAAGLQGGFVSQEIVTAGKLRLGRAVASHGIQRARYLLEVQRMRVLNDVRAQFCAVLLAQRVIEVNQQLVGISEETLKTTERLQKAQEVGLPDVLQSQIEVETTRVSVATARNRHWSAWRQLAALVGRPEMEPVKLQGDCKELLPLLPWEELHRKLLTENPMLAQARARVEQLRCELARQGALRVPNIEVATAVKHDTASGYTVADVAIGIPLPIHNRNQGNIVRAQARLVAAEKEVQRLELVLQRELADVYEQYLTARQQVEAYTERILPAARRSLELIQTGYQQGEFGHLDVLTAQRTLFTTNLTCLANLQELAARRVMLEGLLLRGGLEGTLAEEGPLE